MLEQLGFTQEELQERVIERICGQFLDRIAFDPDSDQEYPAKSSFSRKLEQEIQKRIDATINAFGEKYVLPNVEDYIKNITLQTTNEYGEKKGAGKTFIEYLVERANAYMTEKVNYNGKGKSEERDSYGWNGTQTRIAHMIHQHLHYHIEALTKKVLAGATSTIAESVQETVKIKLAEAAAAMKIEVKTK